MSRARAPPLLPGTAHALRWRSSNRSAAPATHSMRVLVVGTAERHHERVVHGVLHSRPAWQGADLRDRAPLLEKFAPHRRQIPDMLSGAPACRRTAGSTDATPRSSARRIAFQALCDAMLADDAGARPARRLPDAGAAAKAARPSDKAMARRRRGRRRRRRRHRGRRGLTRRRRPAAARGRRRRRRPAAARGRRRRCRAGDLAAAALAAARRCHTRRGRSCRRRRPPSTRRRRRACGAHLLAEELRSHAVLRREVRCSATWATRQPRGEALRAERADVISSALREAGLAEAETARASNV